MRSYPISLRVPPMRIGDRLPRHSLSNAKILVTGAAGFIGRPTATALAALGADVRVLPGPPGKAPIAPVPGCANHIVEIEDADLLEHLAQGRDSVVPLEGRPSGRV